MNTTIPWWTREPVPGVQEHDVAVPDELLAPVREVGPLSTAVLAAHAVVLAALSGEAEVVTGVGSGACRIDTRQGSWRALLRAVEQTAPDPAGPPFETEVGTGDLAPGTVLGVGLRGTTLRVRYRTDVLDAGAAARIAGYHVTALAALAGDPDADPRRASLLSAEELHHQLDGLAGPPRELPDRRAHELFEERVAAHPDAVAAVHGDRRWTYRELNARANRLARALQARGVGREDVVAVVTERNLDWAAAVLAVFKAGGAYLPIEPHFPADRIATTLTRAGCRLVLTETGATITLDKALDELPGVTRLLVDTAYAEDHADGDLGVAVAPDQLAYIYFTSGSTGQPKGAMCEHAGMLNHLFAKIDDLGIGRGTVVAQVAPQCFDISLWQLVSALLVGGETHVVAQEVVLDVARFVDTLAAARVEVLQVVPSYLEVVLTHLERNGRELQDLRAVSATGEALKVELAERFFAVMAELGRPGVALVNAYGLTETSDDTNHEVMHSAPRDGRMPLGRTVQNVRVYVVDSHLAPVPLGAPGLIAFSGVCVGRGYVNDPERSAACYLTDPHRPGERLYLGGDYGRWRPDGKLEFLGRRDSQVKISGFRIELGEIDNTLLRAPGVRDGAVVVAQRPDGGKHLVAFYSGPEELDVAVLREHLGAALPHYMVPALFCWRDRLPLTANGKIDNKALTALAGELDDPSRSTADGATEGPATPTERRLAAAWAEVLGTPEDRVGRRDHFFDRGGSSLQAVELAVALDRAVKLKDIVRHPVLADLAALLDTRA